uniref:Putative secreted protein n=1 Tax=Anopheles darlingi TaxID=43151 RepID=A0A2M4DB99_ANODA
MQNLHTSVGLHNIPSLFALLALFNSLASCLRTRLSVRHRQGMPTSHEQEEITAAAGYGMRNEQRCR